MARRLSALPSTSTVTLNPSIWHVIENFAAGAACLSLMLVTLEFGLVIRKSPYRLGGDGQSDIAQGFGRQHIEAVLTEAAYQSVREMHGRLDSAPKILDFDD